jgi:hypothetical protein
VKNLLEAFRHLTVRQKIVIGALVILVLLTWIAVCVILTIPTPA